MTVDTIEADRASIGARRFGYAVAVGVNVLLLVVVNNILDWGWVPWLSGYPDHRESGRHSGLSVDASGLPLRLLCL